ncbi:MAG: hypothetical protein GX464_14130, partial [Holophagae bacterium]|nr:hypothetical protein [Holophagae bacterium]
GSRQVVTQFSGYRVTSDAGGLLLREVEAATGIVRRLAACFVDYRTPEAIEHSVSELVAQRVFRLALGYEDLKEKSSNAAKSLASARAWRWKSRSRSVRCRIQASCSLPASQTRKMLSRHAMPRAMKFLMVTSRRVSAFREYERRTTP